MIARWSGVARGIRTADRRAALREAISTSNVGGFPTALERRSPEVMFATGARDVKRRL
jgi:hypothetical protein